MHGAILLLTLVYLALLALVAASVVESATHQLRMAGNEQFAHNGILVADRSFSSVQDWAVDTDPVDDAALLVFRDDRLTGTQITAAKVATNGTQVWGADQGPYVFLKDDALLSEEPPAAEE